MTTYATIYTTAPVELDRPSTVVESVAGYIGGRPVRCVFVPHRDADAQRARYESTAVAVVCDQAEWQRRLAAGLATRQRPAA